MSRDHHAFVGTKQTNVSGFSSPVLTLLFLRYTSSEWRRDASPEGKGVVSARSTLASPRPSRRIPGREPVLVPTRLRAKMLVLSATDTECYGPFQISEQNKMREVNTK